jgi:polyisoprenoid-binding protein YceI
MKKKFVLVALSIVAIGYSAIAGNDGKSTMTVSSEESKVVWVGKKVTGQHTGEISVAFGDLRFDGDELLGGSFEIDMKSITCSDIEDESSNQKLVGHLKSEDFFGVERYSKATFVIKEVEAKNSGKYHVKGDINIKGVTKSIEFPVQVTSVGSKATATATMTIDRSDYNIKYGSGSFFDGLGDKMIYDDFTLDITLVANE